MNLHEDHIIWRGEPTEEYLVRSGRKFLLQDGQNQGQLNYRQFYKKLWNLDLPQKIKITNWRFSCNYLPTFSNLHFKRMMGSATCQRCQTGVEAREHLFRECSRRRIHTDKWVAPNGLMVKINFDTTFNKQRNEPCSGLVVRNERAGVICSKKSCIRTYSLFLQQKRWRVSRQSI